MSLIPDDPAEILNDLHAIGSIFDLTRKQAGHRACAATALEIMLAMQAESDPDGWPWPALSAEYDTWKQTVAPNAPMSVLFGHMRQMDQLEGDQQVAAKRIEQTYGIDAKARVEATKFQEGGLVTGTRQPQRPFYYFGHRVAQRLHAFFDALWSAWI